MAATDLILSEVISTLGRVSLVRARESWACATASFYSELLDTDRISEAILSSQRTDQIRVLIRLHLPRLSP
ncbi:hypothetical protein F4803DRAFT_544228 [Xylaria telfairii]|nr:hypothetical protein F4803DRAFT_544228 [Xylaria telfairii]